ncbi:hypothetical protein GCM10023149_13940 [Mucilaginibacter gynuensis]|uniref:Carrier domain-containing protein n=1 Tax=Mucilaginibacter gynuensis TaxID=1302236 RepID=A0ABP8G3Q8_9SPHI
MHKPFFPLHPAQQEVFVDQLLNIDSAQYNIGGYIVLKGALDKEKFHEAVGSAPVVFDAFKFRFDLALAELGYQYDDSFGKCELVEVDFSDQEDASEEVIKWMQGRFNIPFALSEQTLPFDQYLVKIADDEHWFFGKYHHLITDGYGFIVYVQYVAQKYKALANGDDTVFNYPAYGEEIANAGEYNQSARYKDDEQYWNEKIAAKPQKLLTPKYTLSAAQKASTTYNIDIPAEQRLSLEYIQQVSGAGFQQLTLAALLIYFGNVSADTDFVFGIPVHKRGSKKLRNMVGMFSGVLPFKGSFDKEQTLAGLLADVTNTQKKDYRHYNYPIADLSRNLKLNIADGYLCEVVVNYEPLDFGLDFGDEIEARIIRLGNDEERTPLQLCWRDYGKNQPLQLQIQFRNEYFTAEEIDLLGKRILYIIAQFPQALDKNVGDITILPAAERETLLAFSTYTQPGANTESYPEGKTITDLFEAQVQQYPDAIALLFEGKELSYADLNAKANQLAYYLQKQGVQSETLVPICIERGLGMIVSILAVLKAGGAYVPIDPEYPQDRINYMLEDSGAKLVIGSLQTREKLADFTGIIIELDGIENVLLTESTDNLNAISGTNNLAYVIYTSGSTGKPKGVMVEHKGLVNLAVYHDILFDVQAGTRILQFASFSFDASCNEIFTALVGGGTLVLCRKEVLLSADGFKNLIDTYKVEVAIIPPSFQQIIENDLGTLRSIISAGEALNERLGRHIQSKGVRLINGYGPTEGTVCATLSVDPIRPDGTIVIGKPIDNVQVYLLNDDISPVPIGAYGELCIGGTQVARGYLNRAELTAEKFIDNPFDTTEGAKLYRTGDLCRWLPDGNIEYAGRKDDQVKIRGYRIEPGEIESAVQQSGLVKLSVVVANTDAQGNKRLIGYVVPAEGYTKEGLVKYLNGLLPEYMVPQLWIEEESFKLTTNGKIDKRALKAPDFSDLQSVAYRAPQNETEQNLVQVWSGLLGIEKIGVDDNFFELGGHSLLAMRVISQIRLQTGKELSVRDLFNNPTIALLSAKINDEKVIANQPVLTAGERPADIPLSFSQERLWFIDQMEGSVQYHIPAVFKLKGTVNRTALENTFKAIVNRHEALRTVITAAGGIGYQQVQPKDNWALGYHKTEQNNEAELRSLITTLISKPFDLSADSMLRADLLETGTDEYMLVITMHHIASDGWSGSVLVKEFVELYRSEVTQTAPNLTDLPIQYADYALWQRGYLQGETLEQKLNYWREKLDDVAPLQLPTDHARPAVQSTKGATHTFQLKSGVGKSLQELSREQGATLYMTLLSVFKVLLHRYSGQEDICVGTAVAGRNQGELESLIGFFVNTLALRDEVRGNDTFTQLLGKVKQTTLAAYEHQDVPFEKVVEAVVKERDTSRSPLFQVMMVLQNTPETPALELNDLQLEYKQEAHGTSKFDLTMFLTEQNGEITGEIEYNTDLYQAATIARMIGHYEELIGAVITNRAEEIGKLNILTETEKEQQLTQFNNTQTVYPADKSIAELFEQQVQATPSATALVFENAELTYEELNKKANQLAGYLARQGVTAETLVPLCVERGVEMMVAILAILKAGGAYVPIDPEYPQDRIAYMLEDTDAKLILSTVASRDKLNSFTGKVIELDNKATQALLSNESEENPAVKASANNLAYVIYTSGSTGKPKGVLVEQGNVVSLVKNVSYVDISSDDVVLVTGAPTFDATTFEYWSMLLNGGKLILCKNEDLFIASSLKALITKYGVTTMWFTSSWFNQLTEDSPEVFSGLKTILVGGEKLSEHHIQKIRTVYPALNLINGYGPTENTTFSLTYPITNPVSNPIPIGKPLNNRTAYVLNGSYQLVPVGAIGEIYLGGAGLSRGYLNREELTREKFISNPYDTGGRLYSTGDLGKWLPDGSIEYIGRKDDQVKIRGFRIEPGEIESVVKQSGLVKQAVVIVGTDAQGSKRLIGYVIPYEGYSKENLLQYLNSVLPDYMVPQLWVEEEIFKLTANGKIDKRALKAPDMSGIQSVAYRAPDNETEEKLVQIWSELLGIEKIGTEDSFFELGGHSLLAMRLIHRIETGLSISIPVNMLFRFTTIKELGRYIETQTHREPVNEKRAFKVMDI